MKTYKIKHLKDYGITDLSSKKWNIKLMRVKGHIHVFIKGPKFRKSGLTSIKAELSPFESKVVSLYLYKIVRNAENKGERPNSINIKSINYAEVFGSCFD